MGHVWFNWFLLNLGFYRDFEFIVNLGDFGLKLSRHGSGGVYQKHDDPNSHWAGIQVNHRSNEGT